MVVASLIGAIIFVRMQENHELVFDILWVSALAYPTYLGLKGFVVVYKDVTPDRSWFGL